MNCVQGFKCATNIVAKITINTPIPPDYPALIDGQKRDVFVTDPIVSIPIPSKRANICFLANPTVTFFLN